VSRLNRSLVILAAVLAVVVLPASPALAQYAPCDPSTLPAAQLTGVPSIAVEGRDYYLGFSATEATDGQRSVSGDYTVTLSEGGRPYWSGTVDQYEPDRTVLLHVNAGQGQITVTASWPEQDFSSPDACQRVVTRVVPDRRGRAIGRPRVHAGGDIATVTLQKARTPGCSSRYAVAPLLLSIKARKASNWTYVAVSDQCDGWDDDRGGTSSFDLIRQDAAELIFQPSTERTSTKFYSYRLAHARFAKDNTVVPRKLIEKGTIRVRAVHYRARRVYGFHPSGRINDEYWNYCVNEGKRTWMHNGNPYCWMPAGTDRRVSLR
jgi:hypothetical protein